MSNDWRLKIVEDFARRNGVEIITEDDWKRYRIRIRMRRTGGTCCVERLISYDAAQTLLPSLLLKDMYQELSRETEAGA